MPALINPKSFHARGSQEHNRRGSLRIPLVGRKRYIVEERDLRYHFELLTHPAVSELMQRFMAGGVEGLLSADTEQGLHIKLLEPGTWLDENNAAITLPPGRLLVLIDGATVRMSDGLLAQSVGPRLTLIAKDADIKPAPGTPVSALAGTAAFDRAHRKYILQAAIRVELVHGTPQPSFLAELFQATSNVPSELVSLSHPVKDLDFNRESANAVYNWELFFHVPLTIAISLSKNQWFAEAQRWFHHIFDPTTTAEGGPERFWKFRHFQTTGLQQLQTLIENLTTNVDQKLRDDTVLSIMDAEANPFRPHLVARYRTEAYMRHTVMAYLDNLIAWGDSLFRQDTGEAIDEAAMLYVMAANILGPKPQQLPSKDKVRPRTYANLRDDLNRFGDALVAVESEIPFDILPMPRRQTTDDGRLATLHSMHRALYFCVPPNDKLLQYWDTVADRLFKIRNSLNLQGSFRQLALFEPPIDPALLARGVAAGLDVGAIVNGLNQPLPQVRFTFLVQRAAEICQEVKSLGNSLLAAMEREDNEALAILRSKHERAVMRLVEQVRYSQVVEASKSLEGMESSLANAVQRYVFYERQLGREKTDIENGAKPLENIDRTSLEKMTAQFFEPLLDERKVRIENDQDSLISFRKAVDKYEKRELVLWSAAQTLQSVNTKLSVLSHSLQSIPKPSVLAAFLGVGGSIEPPTPKSFVQIAMEATDCVISDLQFAASLTGKIGAFARREQEWAFQSNLAAGEINQVYKQIRAAQIREAIAGMELRNHRKQMQQAEEMEHFLNEDGANRQGKQTNRALHAWMKREVKGLYAQCFQFAFDIAKKAERALQHELGNTALNYVRYDYLAGKEGLLAGERLYLDIKRMEMAYHEQNQREYELVRHVSLNQLDPLALLQLRFTGRCTVSVPETFFDLDTPGHYFRRLRTVSLSIPCVTGPYTSVSCKLTLLRSSIRTSPALVDGDEPYARDGIEDPRFSDHFGNLQSIVTSSGQNDAGLFEANLRDERYLPFEHCGAISDWRIELPSDPTKDEPRTFDYETISDLVLHLHYTAREGGEPLRNSAKSAVQTALTFASLPGISRIFSLRHDFPSEWADFQASFNRLGRRPGVEFRLTQSHYPYWVKTKLSSAVAKTMLAQTSSTSVNIYDTGDESTRRAPVTVLKHASFSNIIEGNLQGRADIGAVGSFGLYTDREVNKISDLWLMVSLGE